MKILDSFEAIIESDCYNDSIKKINNILIDRKIDADNIILIKFVSKDKFYYYTITYKKELKTYDSDPRMR